MKSCRIITGGKGEGKSSLIMSRALSIPNSAGFIMPVTDNGYALYAIRTKKAQPFMTDKPLFPDRIGKWFYDQRLFDAAVEELSEVYEGSVFIDEVGRLELRGGGYAPVLRLLRSRDVDLTITVRRDFLDDVISTFFPGEKVLVEELS